MPSKHEKRQTYFFIPQRFERVHMYEKHIIYVFVLFSHNFIINVYHHYCSYSISHSSVLILLPDEKLFASFFFSVFWLEIKSGHGKQNAEDGKFPISRGFHISIGRTFLICESFKKIFSKVNWTLSCWFALFPDSTFNAHKSATWSCWQYAENHQFTQFHLNSNLISLKNHGSSHFQLNSINTLTEGELIHYIKIRWHNWTNYNNLASLNSKNRCVSVGKHPKI